MKLPSTTKRFGTSWLRQYGSSTDVVRIGAEAAGAVLQHQGRVARRLAGGRLGARGARRSRAPSRSSHWRVSHVVWVILRT